MMLMMTMMITTTNNNIAFEPYSEFAAMLDVDVELGNRHRNVTR